ncbi:S8/S53 family peptidase, partial [Myxococcota bacterium]|nr:S8/S53 family peptidase [Myxococcota bacterium]
MKTKTSCSFLLPLLLVFLPFELAGCSSSPSDPAGSTYTPATDIYTKPIDATRMVSYTENDVTYHFVDNQILVFLEELSMNENLVATVAATADGTVVGRIPDIGMVQLETASLSVAEMALTIESLEGIAGVTAAFPNLIRQVDAVDSCRRSGDLALNLPAESAAPERCAYEFPKFFNLLPVMRKFRSMGLLSPVKVAVIDMHFQGLNEQFNQARITRLGLLPGSYYENAYPHGFWVTGILAADDDGQSLAGILPSALGSDGFELFIGDVKAEFDGENWGLDSSGSWDLLVRAARDAKVDVINLSSGTFCEENSIFQCIKYIGIERSILTSYPNTLFVVSAGTGSREITGLNRTPSGIRGVPNLITVAGTDACNPLTKHKDSNFGEGSV